jgi:amino acid transporter
VSARSGIDILILLVGLLLIYVAVHLAVRSIVGWRALRNKPSDSNFISRQASSPVSLMVPALFALAIGAMWVYIGLFGHDGVLRQ